MSEPTRTGAIVKGLDDAVWLQKQQGGARTIDFGCLSYTILTFATVLLCSECGGTGQKACIAAGVVMDHSACPKCGPIRAIVKAWQDAR